MERRSFFKFLGLAMLAPKAAVEVLSKIKVPQPSFGAMVADLFKRQRMTYDIFAKSMPKPKPGKGYWFDVKPRNP